MIVNGLSLSNFRNYIAARLDFSAGINVLIGENAQGKTNILEAVRYVSLGRSHRTRNDDELINWQNRQAHAGVDFSRRGVENRLEFFLTRKERPKIMVNSHPVTHGELIGSLNTVLFSPEDLYLIKGAPVLRRRFLDSEISQASPGYYRELIKYNRLLNQRDRLLKDIREKKATENLLDAWEPQLAVGAALVVSKRLEAVDRLNRIAGEMQKFISGTKETLEIGYNLEGKNGSISENLAAWYENELIKARERDIWRGHTGIGPHHDDIYIMVNGVNLRSFGSQGQQRTAILALKLAELNFLREETGEYPVLLLDDVMSELDGDRRQKLLEFMEAETVQTLITATDEAYLPQNHGATVFEVRAGNAQRR